MIITTIALRGKINFLREGCGYLTSILSSFAKIYRLILGNPDLVLVMKTGDADFNRL